MVHLDDRLSGMGLLTRDLGVALLLGAFEFAVKSILQFGHERLWTRLGFGLRAVTPPPGHFSKGQP